MNPDDQCENPSKGREHVEVIAETIDRNRDRDWEEYKNDYEYTLISDGRVLVTPVDESEDAESPENSLSAEIDYTVELSGGKAVGCNCHIARRPIDPKGCRHMRAVNAHPKL